ncbi:MAG: methyltransferase domain-containing protein [Chloroflexi bacterium]|nr:methyltransferase domain-containing protein [Chloroflexota bacterium]
MKIHLLDYLVCPECKGSLRCHPQEGREGEVETGALHCTGCAAEFPIVRGIPRFVRGALSADKARTADAFGWEWQEFSELHDSWETYEQQFLDWIAPLTPDFFREKVVLDAGCGMGRFSAAAVRFGAREVIAIDLSDAVESARRTTAALPNVHVVQADIYHLPFARPFDFAFSIGVLHHLPDPEGGFQALVRHLKDGGSIFGWVYGRENNGWLVYVGNPLRERVFSRLPRPILYGLSFLVTAGLHPLLKLLYRPADGGPVRPLASRLPYRGYLTWLAQFGFRHNHHVVFDHMVAPTAFYLRREEFAAWFQRAGLEDVQLSWRNQNSWRGLGRRPAGVATAQPAISSAPAQPATSSGRAGGTARGEAGVAAHGEPVEP